MLLCVIFYSFSLLYGIPLSTDTITYPSTLIDNWLFTIIVAIMNSVSMNVIIYIHIHVCIYI